MKNQNEWLFLADQYRFLSLILAYPDEENHGASQILGQLLAESELCDPDFKSFVLEIIKAGNDHQKIIQDYSRIFISGGLYITEGAVTTRFNAVNDLGAYYTAFGFSPKSGEAPDCIIYELEFAALLCLKIAIAPGDEEREIALQAYHTFTSDHCIDFTEKFAHSLLRGDAGIYYTPVGNLLLEFVKKNQVISPNLP